MGRLLNQIKEPNDIKRISPKLYPVLAEEIRDFLLNNVSQTGGHLASNLGAVEITMALHICLRFPEDKVVYDVGHQSYVHKILTGRKDEFSTLRQKDGLCGFPKRSESECDVFGTGHSSTSISAALGLAVARDLEQKDNTVAAVIGDGALSGGMAYEALNNLSILRKEKKNMIIILNDNKMSISENVGGMSRYLNDLRSRKSYSEFKENVESALNNIPGVGKSVARTLKKSKDSIKQLFIPGMLFENMGITYYGLVNGHDIYELIHAINRAKQHEGPILIHAITRKGMGYKNAEKNPEKFHGIGPFDRESGELLAKKTKKTYTDVFADSLVALAKNNKKIVAITAAMPSGTGLKSFKKYYPKRFFDKLFAEQPLAKQMGYTAGYFSFNTEGGRCEECKGDGTVTVEMQFMADLVLECESCHGKRFKSDTLEVKFQDKNIYDILEMTVNQAIEFFTEYNQKKIVKKLTPLQEVGLGYIKLGQASSTLSGGENQRVKLAYFLSIEKAQPTIFVFDEPTTGLHFHDIKKLLEAFEALISRGHTIIIIEHNMDVIKCADHVIDLGPEGGNMGGNLVVAGTPEEVAACAASYTGQFLKEKLAMDSPD